LVAYRRGEYATTTALCHQALIVQERLGDRAGILSTLRLLADTAMATGDLARAMVYGRRSLALAQAADLMSELAEAHFVMACANRLQKNFAEAKYHAELALALFARFGNRSFTAYTLYEQSVIQKFEGRVDAALPVAQRAYAIQVELGDSYGRVTSLLNLGDLYKLCGEFEKATATWREGWTLGKEISYPYLQAFERRMEAELLENAGTDHG
jgi:tetratricopeptide (TPR) repeat protein